MKSGYKIIILILIVFLSVFLVFSGCDSDSSISIAEDLFLDALKAAAPGFTSASSRAVWSSGNPIFEIYDALNESGDRSGYFNVYDLMDVADSYFSVLDTSGSAITLQSIDLPAGMDPGYSSQYNLYHEYDGSLYSDGSSSKTYGRVDGAEYSMLVVNRNTNGGEDSNSVIQGTYNSSTNEIDLSIIYVNYVDSRYEKVRARVTGNTETHLFTLKLIRDGGTGGYDFNLISYGISEGSGNMFLAELANNSTDMGSAVYYEFDSGAMDETSLQAMADAGSSTDPGNTGYGDEIAAVTAFTGTDLPTDVQVSSLNIFSAVIHD